RQVLRQAQLQLAVVVLRQGELRRLGRRHELVLQKVEIGVVSGGLRTAGGILAVTLLIARNLLLADRRGVRVVIGRSRRRPGPEQGALGQQRDRQGSEGSDPAADDSRRGRARS